MAVANGVPETRYVEVGGAEVAYQLFGAGAVDLLYCYGLGSHLELAWDLPWVAEAFRRLGSFCRVVVFDRRGTGASDGVRGDSMPTWEEWAEDMGAVLEAAGSERSVVFASNDAGPAAMLFAASQPARVSALVLLNTTARSVAANDYPLGVPVEMVDATVEMVRAGWGKPELAAASCPSFAGDPARLTAIAKIVRAACTPRTAAAQFEYVARNLDVRNVLPLIQAPTLVLHVRDSFLSPVGHGQYLAEHISGARLVELPGGDIGFTDQMLDVVDEVSEFLTGTRLDVDVDRVLATILFTDIVDSTQRAAALGDHEWRRLLDAHDQTVRDTLRRHRGREVNTTGDGFIASFDGPARAIRCAQAIAVATSALGLEVRSGLHTGECEVRGEDLAGVAVHIAARVSALATPGEVLVSGTLKDLVIGSGLEFDERGEHELKGLPGKWPLFTARHTH